MTTGTTVYACVRGRENKMNECQENVWNRTNNYCTHLLSLTIHPTILPLSNFTLLSPHPPFLPFLYDIFISTDPSAEKICWFSLRFFFALISLRVTYSVEIPREGKKKKKKQIIVRATNFNYIEIYFERFAIYINYERTRRREEYL